MAASQASRGRQLNSGGATRDQDPRSPEGKVDPWKHSHLQVQNTFLTVSPPLCETASGFIEVRRQISDPTSSRSSSLSSAPSNSFGDSKSGVGAASSDARRQAHRVGRNSRDRKKEDGSDSDCSKGSGSSTKSGSKESRNRNKGKPRRNEGGGGGECPVDENGEPTSMGSALHAEGQCKPCAFHPTSSGCAMGSDCRFCHLPHKSSGKIRLRPCKGKRMRTKRMFDRLTTQITEDPDNFDPAALDLPPSIEQNSVVKSRLIGRLLEYADQARAGRSSASEGEGEPPTESAARPRGGGPGSSVAASSGYQ